MITYDTQAVSAAAVSASPGRPATALMHDVPDVRLVIFRIGRGQEVPRHTNPSTVILTVLAGSGVVLGADGDRAVRAGTVIAYEPNEPHGMRAVDDGMVVLATIAPRPGAATAQR